MKVTVLIDDTPSTHSGLLCEHGLSLYVETDFGRYLLDTGLTGQAIDNALALGIDLRRVDALILSHGHKDHTGGLSRFLSVNTTAPVYVSDKVFRYTYASNRGGRLHDLSPQDCFRRMSPEWQHNTWTDRFRFLGQSTWLPFPSGNVCGTARMACVFNQSQTARKPGGNRYLSIAGVDGWQPYQADDEMAWVIEQDGALTIFSSCTHSGMLNVLQSCTLFTGCPRVRTFIGGLHLLDDEAQQDDLESMAVLLAQDYPGIDIVTGHCTGQNARRILQQAADIRCRTFYTGLQLFLPFEG